MEGSLEELTKAIRDAYGYKYEIEVFDRSTLDLIKKDIENINGVDEIIINNLRIVVNSRYDIIKEIAKVLKDLRIEIKTFREIPPSWEQIYTILYEKSGGEVSV